MANARHPLSEHSAGYARCATPPFHTLIPWDDSPDGKGAPWGWTDCERAGMVWGQRPRADASAPLVRCTQGHWCDGGKCGECMTQRRTGARGPWDEARTYDWARARGQGQSRARASGGGGSVGRQPGGSAGGARGGGGSGCALWPLLALVVLCALLGGVFAWRTTPLNALGTTSTRKLVT